jgi:hypothetical protein
MRKSWKRMKRMKKSRRGGGSSRGRGRSKSPLNLGIGYGKPGAVDRLHLNLSTKSHNKTRKASMRGG